MVYSFTPPTKRALTSKIWYQKIFLLVVDVLQTPIRYHLLPYRHWSDSKITHACRHSSNDWLV